MFEAIQLISNIPWTIKFKLQSHLNLRLLEITSETNSGYATVNVCKSFLLFGIFCKIVFGQASLENATRETSPLIQW